MWVLFQKRKKNEGNSLFLAFFLLPSNSGKGISAFFFGVFFYLILQGLGCFFPWPLKEKEVQKTVIKKTEF